MSGLRRIRFIVSFKICSCPDEGGGGKEDIASTVASYPKHSVMAVISVVVSCKPAAPSLLLFVCNTETEDIESPTITSQSCSSHNPPSTKPETTVIPNPSLLPPLISCNSIPNPTFSVLRRISTMMVSTNNSREFSTPSAMRSGVFSLMFLGMMLAVHSVNMVSIWGMLYLDMSVHVERGPTPANGTGASERVVLVEIDGGG
mmetsp:Transcript_63227/g.93820  ORF Transcript_63227/g.93820 Transcript_63227/m.93820 type:complete len:202 (-) Transcript_63227:211-816(-)